jgi:hypothetical protein
MRRLFGAASLLILLYGCGGQLNGARSADRQTTLRSCSRSVVAIHPRDVRELVASLRRLEACMALRNLPGHAVFDPVAKSVNFAYEAEFPTLHF